jgi:predicted phosphodiesterase
MIAFIGDLHANYRKLQAILDEIAKRPQIVAVIQVGDWGWYTSVIPEFMMVKYPVPTYFVDGNHEDFIALPTGEGPQMIAPNCYYVPRGSVLTIDNRKIAFLGGAGSVDYQFNSRWSPLENILPAEAARLDGVDNVDILVTHCPPQSVIQRHFDPHNLLWFGLPITWKDKNADVIEDVWAKLGYPFNISGHMHRSVIGEKYRILDIEELFCL